MRKNKNNVIILFLLSTIISIVFHDLIFGVKVLVSGDNLSPIAIKNGIRNYLALNNLYPYWMPWILGGLPTVHSFLNVSDHYFPHKLIVFLKQMGMPWIWNFLFHLIFGGFGMYKILRFFKQNIYASFITSILFMLMPYQITMTVHGHGSQMMTGAYIPWIILYLFKINKDNASLNNYAILSLLIGLQLQRGHVQIAYYTWMMLGLFILLNTIFHFQKFKFNFLSLFKRLYLIIFSLLLGLLLSFNLFYGS